MNPTVFVQAMLPHREQFAEHEDGSPVLVPTGRIDADGNPEVRRALAGVYSARNGDLTLTVRSGYRNPQRGTRPESIGIPYGGMARLLLTWIVTEASKRNEQTLDLGETLTSFFDQLNIATTGGATGRIPYVMDQLERLATCAISYRWEYLGHGRSDVAGENLLVVNRYHFWDRSSDAGAPDMRGGSIRISDGFWNQIMTSVFPLDFRKAQYFRKYPTAFDLYLWLTYRIGSLERTGSPHVYVNFDQLHKQLGSHYQSDATGELTAKGKKNFALAVRKALEAIRETWPALRVDTPPGRIKLYASSGTDVKYRAPKSLPEA